ncbi:MAG: hypothetical protein ACOZQL_36285 [Myxococcota bacterium]
MTLVHPQRGLVVELTADGAGFVELTRDARFLAGPVERTVRASEGVAVREDELLELGFVPLSLEAVAELSPWREWRALASGQRSLLEHWAPTGAPSGLVSRLAERVLEVSWTLTECSLDLGGGLRLSCAPPLHPARHAGLPAAVRPLLAVHARLSTAGAASEVDVGWEARPAGARAALLDFAPFGPDAFLLVANRSDYGATSWVTGAGALFRYSLRGLEQLEVGVAELCLTELLRALER